MICSVSFVFNDQGGRHARIDCQPMRRIMEDVRKQNNRTKDRIEMNIVTVKKALANPESINWSHRTVKNTTRLFNGLVKAAKNGHWVDAINVYFAIAKSGNMNLITGQRLMDIWKAEYMHGENGETIPESKFHEIRDTYLHYFRDVMSAHPSDSQKAD